MLVMKQESQIIQNSFSEMKHYKRRSLQIRRSTKIRNDSTYHAEKAMAPHSNTLAWKIPQTEEPGKDHGVAKSWTRLSHLTFTFHFHALEKEMATHSSVLAWRIPGLGSLVGCRLWGRTNSDTTEATQQQQQQHIVNFCFH